MSDCRVPMPVYEQPCPYCHDGKLIETEVDGDAHMKVERFDDEYRGDLANLNVYIHREDEYEWVGCFGILACPMCGRKLADRLP